MKDHSCPLSIFFSVSNFFLHHNLRSVHLAVLFVVVVVVVVVVVGVGFIFGYPKNV